MPTGAITYRFAHESDSRWHEVEFDGNSVTLGDLKVLVAQHSGLAKEFARRFDLRMFYASPSASNSSNTKNVLSRIWSTSTGFAPEGVGAEIVKDSEILHGGAQVIVQRELWRKLDDIKHEARRDLTEEEWRTTEQRQAEQKKKFPVEYLCPMCGFVLDTPMVVRCLASCPKSGKSACRSCIDTRMKANGGFCPFCDEVNRTRVKNVIVNKALQSILKKIEWDEFDFPKRSEQNHAISPENTPASNTRIVSKEESESGSVSTSMNSPGNISVGSNMKISSDPNETVKSEILCSLKESKFPLKAAVGDDALAAVLKSNVKQEADQTNQFSSLADTCVAYQSPSHETKTIPSNHDGGGGSTTDTSINGFSIDDVQSSAVSGSKYLDANTMNSRRCFLLLLHPINLKLVYEQSRMIVENETELGRAISCQVSDQNMLSLSSHKGTSSYVVHSTSNTNEVDSSISSSGQWNNKEPAFYSSDDHHPGQSSEITCIPIARTGGGTSYAVGGLARIQSLDWAAIADRSAALVLSQWHEASTSAAQSEYNDSGNNMTGHRPSASSSRRVVMLEWIERCPSLVFIPCKAQPLLSIFRSNAKSSALLKVANDSIDDAEFEIREDIARAILNYARQSHHKSSGSWPGSAPEMSQNNGSSKIRPSNSQSDSSVSVGKGRPLQTVVNTVSDKRRQTEDMSDENESIGNNATLRNSVIAKAISHWPLLSEADFHHFRDIQLKCHVSAKQVTE